jgi:cytosine/adenosine deaminase-related metal-dependent hydrolase
MALAQTRTPSAGVPKGPMVIEAGWVLAWANNRLELLRDASILVRDDKIEEVRTGRIRGEFARVRMPDQVVLPGFISGHTHACSATPTRGIIEGGRSSSWSASPTTRWMR